MTTPTAVQRTHQKAVRFFWGLLFTATAVSLIGNVAHAVLPFIPRVLVQIGAAAVPPVALLAAVHGIALAVRAGASGTIYRCAIGAVGIIGLGAFAMSFLALRDLMLAVGYSAVTAWMFPAIIDTAVAVSTLMLVALGDKPARRVRTANTSSSTERTRVRRDVDGPVQGANPLLKPVMRLDRRASAMHGSAQTETSVADANLAAELIASRATTQPIETVIAVLTARRRGASINAAAKELRINYRTAQRIVEAAEGATQAVLEPAG